MLKIPAVNLKLFTSRSSLESFNQSPTLPVGSILNSADSLPLKLHQFSLVRLDIHGTLHGRPTRQISSNFHKGFLVSTVKEKIWLNMVPVLMTSFTFV